MGRIDQCAAGKSRKRFFKQRGCRDVAFGDKDSSVRSQRCDLICSGAAARAGASCRTEREAVCEYGVCVLEGMKSGTVCNVMI